MNVVRRNIASGKFFRLRRGLRCWLREIDDVRYYAVEDPASGAFYRIGAVVWELASRLDGATTIADAAAKISCDAAADVSPQEAEKMLRPLVAAGLVIHDSSEGLAPKGAEAAKGGRTATKFNPFFLRIPLVRPDRQIEAALPWCRWLISRPFFVIWLIVVLAGVSCIGAEWSRFSASARIFLTPRSWIYLGLAWFILKLAHEFFHGLVCKKYGGSIGSAGAALILFAPVAYVDVTSVWRFRSKWPRIYTSAAGMYIELLIAGVAAIVWSRLDAGAASQVCQSIVVMASLATLLFNANPLMRFDGYFILSDLLDLPNLYSAGQTFVRNAFRRVYLGIAPIALPTTTRAKRWIIRIYGVAAALWRVVVCASMILIASTLFRGAGLAIACFGVVTWFGLPIYRLTRFLVAGSGNQQPNRIRFAAAGVATCTIGYFILCMPWPGRIVAPAVVAYAQEHIVRTATDGFIEHVHVSPGQHVQANQLLVTLRNDELESELAVTTLAVQQSEIRARMLLSREGQHPAYQAELERLAALEEREQYLRYKADSLQVRADRAGVVLGTRLHDMEGRFAAIGTPLMTVAQEDFKQIEVSISESQFDAFVRNIGATPNVRVHSRSSRVKVSQLAKVEPHASSKLRHPALAARFGGPLAIRQVASDDDGSASGIADFELAAPRFRGVIALPPQEAVRLRAGQLAKVRVEDSNSTIGRRTYQAIRSWVENKLNRNNTTERT